MNPDLAVDLLHQADFIHNACYDTQVIDILDLDVKVRIIHLSKILFSEHPTCEMWVPKEDLGYCRIEVSHCFKIACTGPAAPCGRDFPIVAAPFIENSNQHPRMAALPQRQSRISLNDDIANNCRSARVAHAIEHCSFDVPDIGSSEVIADEIRKLTLGQICLVYCLYVFRWKNIGTEY